MENKIKCQNCGNDEVWKAGKPREKQQYKCKACKRKFIMELNYSKEFKQKAIAIFFEGNSGRAVGRMMGINKSTVYNWIKKLDKKTESPACSQEQLSEKPQTVNVIEMDEFLRYC